MNDTLKNNQVKALKICAENFLKKHSMHYSEIDMEKQVDLFISEMNAGLAGEESSLKMYPTFIGFEKGLQPDEPVLALDAGGTNLRSAIVSFDENGRHKLSRLSRTRMPGIESEATIEQFFSAIADNLEDKIRDCRKIGFVFSYPIEIFPNRDGKLIRFTKEIKARQVEGQFIGKKLKEELSHRGYKNVKDIVLLNDTAASLLAGITAFKQRQYSSYIGFVLGTGMNACYIESNSNIKKLPEGQLDSQNFGLVNIEAGQYLKGPLGLIDKEFDSKTLNPSLSTYEKMFSGAYLGALTTEVIRFAVMDGLFSGGFAKVFNEFEGFKSKDIDDYLYFPPQDERLVILLKKMDSRDMILLHYLFDSMIERAAILASIVLASAIIKADAGHDPCNPVCIVAEGSSFYKMKNFHSRLDFYIKKILSVKGIYNFEINKVDDAIMIGAAVAGISPCC